MGKRGEACGLEFAISAEGRRWRFRRSWVEKVEGIIMSLDLGVENERQRAAGYALWFVRVQMLPLYLIWSLIRPEVDREEEVEAEREVTWVTRQIRRNPWRALKPGCLRSLRPDPQAPVVWTDGSIHAAGAIDHTGRAVTVTWGDATRLSTRQQESELEAAVYAIERFVKEGDTVLVVDNMGTLFILLGGNPANKGAIPLLCRVRRCLEARRTRLWLAWTEGAMMPADEWSRPRDLAPGQERWGWGEPMEGAAARARKEAVEVEWSVAVPLVG